MVASITRKAYDESIIIITIANLCRDDSIRVRSVIDTDRINRHTWPVLATPQAPPSFTCACSLLVTTTERRQYKLYHGICSASNSNNSSTT